jgi:large subunit ribosomal protein L25
MATGTIPQIDVETRQTVGTRDSKRRRQEGKLPMVLYGHGQAAVHLLANAKEVFDLLHHNTHLLEIKVNGKSENCLVKQVQWNHLGSSVLHVDLNRVDLDEEVTVTVEIKFKGEPQGLKEEEAAFLEHPTTELDVECKANAIPDELTIDVSDMAVGDAKTASEVPLPAGVKLVTDPDATVATVQMAQVEEEEELEAEVGAEEPEVIGREDAEGEEGEAAGEGEEQA